MTRLALLWLLVLLSLPHAWEERAEPPDARAERLARVAVAVERARERAIRGPDPVWPGAGFDLAVLLLARAQSESHLTGRIQAGRCRKYECGRRRGGPARWVSYWQIAESPVVPRSEWRRLAGSDQASVDRAAWAAARVLAVGYRKCGTIHGAISIYRGKSRCAWPGARGGLRVYQKIRRRSVALRAGLARAATAGSIAAPAGGE